MSLFTQKALEISLPNTFLPFVAFATLTSYSFHAYLNTFYLPPKKSPRLIWIDKNRTFLIVQSIIAAIITGIFYLNLIPYSIYIIPIILITFLYSAPQISVKPFIYLRKIAIGKTLYLSFAWTYVSCILPLLIGGLPLLALQNIYFIFNRFLLIFIIAILFDKKDRETDKSLQIKSLITHLSLSSINRLIYICCFLFLITCYLFHQQTQNAYLTFALVLPIIILSLSLPYIEKTDNDYLYYGYLDGLLLISGIYIIIPL